MPWVVATAAVKPASVAARVTVVVVVEVVSSTAVRRFTEPMLRRITTDASQTVNNSALDSCVRA
jgi:hypothetical protein